MGEQLSVSEAVQMMDSFRARGLQEAPLVTQRKNLFLSHPTMGWQEHRGQAPCHLGDSHVSGTMGGELPAENPQAIPEPL